LIPNNRRPSQVPNWNKTASKRMSSQAKQEEEEEEEEETKL
jgi:hypothetical protein